MFVLVNFVVSSIESGVVFVLRKLMMGKFGCGMVSVDDNLMMWL